MSYWPWLGWVEDEPDECDTLAKSLRIPVVEHSRVPGWPECGPEPHPGGMGFDPLARVLFEDFESDAHFLAYSCPGFPARVNQCVFSLLPGTVVRMVLQVFDVDCPDSHRSHGGDHKQPAPDSWWDEECIKLRNLFARHPGAFVYRTKGGYRIVYIRTRPFQIHGKDSSDAWAYDYFRCCCYLARAFGITADPACANWNRLYRAPCATRDKNAGPEDRQSVGDSDDVGFWDHAPSDDDLEADLDIASRMAGTNSIWRGKLNTTLRPAAVRRYHPDRTRTEHRRVVAPQPQTAGGASDDLVAALLPIVAPIDDGRHDLYLALSGTLLDRGLDGPRVLQVVRDLAEQAGDSKVSARVHDAESTIGKHEREEPYTAYSTLLRNWPELATVVDDHVGQELSDGFLALRDEFEAVPVPETFTAEAAYSRISEVIRSAQANPDTLEIVRVSTGTGKTRAAVEEAIARNDRTLLVFPTNALALEHFQHAKTHRSDVARRFGVLSLYCPDGSPACKYHEAAARFQAAGLSVPRMLCTRCDVRDSCSARGGSDGSPEDSLVFANHSLIANSLEQLGQTGLLVVDESPSPFEHMTISVADVRLASSELHNSTFYWNYANGVAPFVFLVGEALLDHFALEPFTDALARKGRELATDRRLIALLRQARVALGTEVDVGGERYGQALALFRKAVHDVARGVDPSLSDRTVGSVRRMSSAADRPAHAGRVLKVLARHFFDESMPGAVRWTDAFQRARARERMADEGKTVKDTDLPEIVFTFANQNLISALTRRGPTVILDATPDVGALCVMAGGRPVNEVVIDVRDGAPVERVHRYFSRGTRAALLSHGKPDWDALGPGLAQVFELLIARNVRTALLITFKGIEEALSALMAGGKSIPHTRAQALFRAFQSGEGKLVLAHYGGIRGRNEVDGVDWEHFDAIVTFADPLRNLGETRREAEVLGLDGTQSERRWHFLAAAELGQAHGRLRAPRRSSPGFCLHLGRITPAGWHRDNASLDAAPVGRPVGLAAMTLKELQDRIDQHGSARALARASGISPSTISLAKKGRPISAKVADMLRRAPLGSAATSCRRGGGDVDETPIREESSPALLTVASTPSTNECANQGAGPGISAAEPRLVSGLLPKEKQTAS